MNLNRNQIVRVYRKAMMVGCSENIQTNFDDKPCVLCKLVDILLLQFRTFSSNLIMGSNIMS